MDMTFKQFLLSTTAIKSPALGASLLSFHKEAHDGRKA